MNKTLKTLGLAVCLALLAGAGFAATTNSYTNVNGIVFTVVTDDYGVSTINSTDSNAAPVNDSNAARSKIFDDIIVYDDAEVKDDLTVGGAVTVGETLDVTGVMSLTAAPKLTAVIASGTATAVMTNAPAITEETPIWINITVGTNSYVTPAWLKD